MRGLTADCADGRRLILWILIGGGLLIGCANAVAEPRGEDVDSLIPWLLENREELKEVPFSEVIAATTGQAMVAVDRREDAEMLGVLGGAIDVAVTRLNDPDHEIHTVGRVNEASRYVEDELRETVGAIPGWTCGVPTTMDGKEQRSGYPDLRIVTESGKVIFLDPKLYAPGSRDSSLRTFYYEPRGGTSKVHEDAVHLLAGFRHNGESGRKFRLDAWELVDLSRLRVKLKAEFQASNRDVYTEETVVMRKESSTAD